MKKTILLALLVCLLLSACSNAKSSASDSSTAIPTEAAEPVAPVTASQIPETTSPAYRTNEKGPFDDEHYEIGAKALAVIDDYLDGKKSLPAASMLLSSCYDDIAALPDLLESDPLYAGNDFVRAYVFLAKVDFGMQMSDFETKKYEDRNYLAAAIGEPARNFTAAVQSNDDAALRKFLDGLVSTLNDAEGDTLYYYSIDEDDVFFTISMPSFDPVYESLDSLSADDLASAREIDREFVAGDFAKDLVEQIHSHGGASMSVYITLGCTHGICMASHDLTVFMDELKK
jgi:hypothetical protein